MTGVSHGRGEHEIPGWPAAVLGVASRVGTVTIVVGVRDRVISDLVPGGVLRAA